MKSAFQFYRGAAVVAFCLVGACHGATHDTASDDSRAGATSEGGAERGGSAAEGGKHAGGNGGSSAAGHPAVGSGDAGQAGAGNEAGDAASGAAGSGDAGSSNTTANATPTECDVDGGIDGGCASNCTGEIVSCGVESFDNFCEFELFHDTPVTVTCGQTATAGIASCGGCGTVAVEVYYDGSQCWEGIPDCPLAGLSGKLLSPHAPLP